MAAIENATGDEGQRRETERHGRTPAAEKLECCRLYGKLEESSGPLCGPSLGLAFRHDLIDHVRELVERRPSAGPLRTKYEGLNHEAWVTLAQYTTSQWAELIGTATSLGEAFAMVLERHRRLYRQALIDAGELVVGEDAGSLFTMPGEPQSGPEVGPVLGMHYRHAIRAYAERQLIQDAGGWRSVLDLTNQQWASMFADFPPANEAEAFAIAGYYAGHTRGLAVGILRVVP